MGILMLIPTLRNSCANVMGIEKALHYENGIKEIPQGKLSLMRVSLLWRTKGQK